MSELRSDIFQAVASGDYRRVKELLAFKPDCESRNEKGQTPLLLAASLGLADIVQALNDAGASLNAKSGDGMGVWDIAIKNADGTLLHVLHDRGVSVPQPLQATVASLLRQLPKGASARGRRTSSATSATRTGSNGQNIMDSSTNLERWKSSGEPRRWVEQHRAGWNHQDWLDLLALLRQSSYWPMEESAIGSLLGAIKSTLPAVETRPSLAAEQSAIDQASCDELLEMATPQLYRRNLFRVLNLPVTATTAEVQRQQRRLEMERKLGRAPSNEGRHALSLVPPPTDDEVRVALDRLRDPESRFLDEMFWFWPTSENAMDDAAICAVQAGDIHQAKEMWARQLNEAGCEQIATHNLAILDHLTALDAELATQSGNENARQSAQAGQLWSQALRRWREVTEGEAFWDRARVRVRQLNDIKLTTGLVRRIRGTMPRALLRINAILAANAAEAGNLSLAKKHLQVIHETNYGDGVADVVLRESLTPIRKRIKVLCDAIGPKADADPEHADSLVMNLLDNAKPLLDVVDAVLSPDDPALQGLHDDVASNALISQIKFGNKTRNWARSLELLEAALKVSVGQAVRERIKQNIEIVKTNKEIDSCFFCGECQPDDPCGIAATLKGDHKHYRYGNTTRHTWNTRKVTVPRCKKCKESHASAARAGNRAGWPIFIKWLLITEAIVQAAIWIIGIANGAPVDMSHLGGAALGIGVFPGGIFVILPAAFLARSRAIHVERTALGKIRPASEYKECANVKRWLTGDWAAEADIKEKVQW